VVDNGAVSQPEPSNTTVTIYRGVALLGIGLMAVGVVGGVFVKGLSEFAVVITTIPGIILLLFAIRGLTADD
jgi:hypothetical protein